MRILLTGATGYVGGRLLPRLVRDGHELTGLVRSPARAESSLGECPIKLVQGDVLSGEGLERALEGVQTAYFLIHAMEPAEDAEFSAREKRGAENFAAAAQKAGVQRIIYLGGPLPEGGPRSRHLASRLAVEEILTGATPESVALRASIVLGGRSRPFRFLVRLIERLPLMALPAWHVHRSSPIDERDVVAMLASAATIDGASGLSLDAAGPEILSYGELMERIRDSMLIGRPRLNLNHVTLTPIASRVASVIAGEEHDLIGPLMESLESDLLPRDNRAAGLLGVRLHSLDAAIERSLRDLERLDGVAAR